MIGVGVSSTRWPLSWLIRACTGLPFSHCWIWDGRQSPPVVVEAGFSGVTETDFPTWRKGKTNVVIRRIETVDLSRALDAAHAWLGEPYDTLGLLGCLWLQVGRWLHKTVINPLASSKSMFCSEFAAAVLKLGGYPGTESLIPMACEPEDVWELVKNEPLEPV